MGRGPRSMRGTWPFAGAHTADVLARVIAAQRNFWGDDVKGPFLVTLFEMRGTGSSGGTGRGDAFAMYATGDLEQGHFLRTIAHEHTHTWIPSRIGMLLCLRRPDSWQRR